MRAAFASGIAICCLPRASFQLIITHFAAFNKKCFPIFLGSSQNKSILPTGKRMLLPQNSWSVDKSVQRDQISHFASQFENCV